MRNWAEYEASLQRRGDLTVWSFISRFARPRASCDPWRTYSKWISRSLITLRCLGDSRSSVTFDFAGTLVPLTSRAMHQRRGLVRTARSMDAPAHSEGAVRFRSPSRRERQSYRIMLKRRSRPLRSCAYRRLGRLFRSRGHTRRPPLARHASGAVQRERWTRGVGPRKTDER